MNRITAATLTLSKRCGRQCTDADAVEKTVRTFLARSRSLELRVSFDGVLALSPSAAAALLVAVNKHRVERGEVRVRLIDLTRHHKETLELALDAIRRGERPAKRTRRRSARSA